MKKYLLNWMTILVVTIMSVGLVSCSDDDKNKEDSASIVGTWVGTYNGTTVTYQFNADRTGSLSYFQNSVKVTGYFTYSYDEKTRYLTIVAENGTKTVTEVIEIYTLTSTMLSGKNIKSGATMAFTRK